MKAVLNLNYNAQKHYKQIEKQLKDVIADLGFSKSDSDNKWYKKKGVEIYFDLDYDSISIEVRTE